MKRTDAVRELRICTDIVKAVPAIIRNSALAIPILLGLGISACAQDLEPPPQKKQPVQTPTPAPTPKLPPDKSKFAVILTGIGGEEEYTTQFTSWARALRDALVEKLGFADEQTLVFVENPSGSQIKPTAEEVRKAFARLKSEMKSDQMLFFFFIGHGSFDGKTAKFNLAGPDLDASDYSALFKSLPAKRATIVNMSSASGEFIKPLSAAGVVVVTATRSGGEQNATRFPQFFIDALTNPEADTDKNGRISVMEAFEYATKLTGEWFKQQGRLITEHALIDDNGDGVGHGKAEAGDGGLARTTYFDSLPQQQAGGDPVLASLFAERLRLEGAIEQLKARKEQMKEEEYEAELERLLLEFAELNRKIRAKQK